MPDTITLSDSVAAAPFTSAKVAVAFTPGWRGNSPVLKAVVMPFTTDKDGGELQQPNPDFMAPMVKGQPPSPTRMQPFVSNPATIDFADPGIAAAYAALQAAVVTYLKAKGAI